MTDPATAKAQTSTVGNFGLWLIIGILLTASFAIATVHLPPNFKKIFLLSIAYATVVAATLFVAASRLKLGQGMPIQLAVFLLVLGGQCLIGWESYRIYLADRMAAIEKEPLAEMALQIAKKTGGEDEHARAMELALRPDFGFYLRTRLSVVWNVASPWPQILWGIEILIAAVAGLWLGRLLIPGDIENRPQQQLASTAEQEPNQQRETDA